MTKAELKNGMGVILANGWYGFVLRDSATNRQDTDLFVDPNGGFNRMSDYANDLTECKYENPSYNIVKVLQFDSVRAMLDSDCGAAKVLWERKEEPKAKKLTLEEVAELLGYPVEIVTTTPPTDEPHKYKVGDKVITTKSEDFAGYEVFPVGTVCRIKKIDEDSKLPYELYRDGGSGYSITWHYSEDMFKPYEAVEDKPHKYKLGDKVVYTDNTWLERDSIGKIIDIDEDDIHMPYEVSFRNGAVSFWMSNDEIKPYKEV